MMASIGENIHTFLAASTGLAAASTGTTWSDPGRIEQNTIPQDPELPRIWYGRTSQEVERDMGGGNCITNSEWAIEIHSTGVGDSLDIADAVRGAMDGHFGAFGANSVHGIFVTDQDDDYIPRGNASEEAICVSALAASITFSTT